MARIEDAIGAFVAAFNEHDFDALVATLASAVTAEVLGSGFGTEQGPADVRAKSLSHMLDVEAWGPLTAHRLRHGVDEWVVFVGKDTGTVECAARVERSSAGITRLEYLVVHFRPDELAAIDRAWGAHRS